MSVNDCADIMKNKSVRKSLKASDFEKAFSDKLSARVRAKINGYNFVYTDIVPKERDYWIRRLVDVLLDPNLVFSGKHRISQWEKGWGQNLGELDKRDKIAAVTPHYFGKYPIVRFNQAFIKPLSKNFERNTLYAIQNWLFDKYLKGADDIYEFGCGTGHNLLLAREYNPTAKICGLDWATSSQRIIDKLAKELADKRLFAHNFDFFAPDNKFKLGKNSVVYTVAALEQVGPYYGKFLNYLLKNKPKLCFHIEPIGELLDQNNLLDYLSVRYFEKRRYLQGFLDHLKKLEGAGKIRVIRAQRSFVGSLFIDGYSVIVWSPMRL